MIFQIIFQEHYLCDLIGWQRKIGNEEAINIARNLAHFTLEIFLKLDQFFSTCTTCFKLKRIHPHTDAHTRSPFFMLPIDGCKVVSILDRSTEIVTTIGVGRVLFETTQKHLTGCLLVQGERMASFLAATSVLLVVERNVLHGRYRAA